MTGQRADARKRAEATAPHVATLGELRNRDDLAHVQARLIDRSLWWDVDEFCGEPDEFEVAWRVVPCPQCDGGEP